MKTQTRIEAFIYNYNRQRILRQRRNRPGTLRFVIILLLMVHSLGVPACASKQLPEPESEPDLFQKAEENSPRIARQFQTKKAQASEKSQAEIILSEDQNRSRAIQKYRALLADKDRLDPATVEASMLNLGHLIFEQCLARYRKAMRSYDDAYKRYQLGYEGAAPARLPKYDFQPAREAYEVFLDAFPDSNYRAEVLYNLAYSYEEEGNLDEAVSLYDELALTASDTRFTPEIFMRLGEHNFETNRFNKAIEYYVKVLELGDTPFYEKAMFKIGWSRYAMNEYQKAQDAFARVLALHTTREKDKRGDLYQESLEILAKTLSETGGATALDAFLKSHQNPGYGLDLSFQLGDYFKETSRYQEAIDTYREILDSYPNAPQAPFVEQSLIEGLKTERRFSEAEGLQASLVDRYGRGTAWDRANQDPELRKQVDGILWEALNHQILAHHKIAREKKDPAEYEKTIALYQKALAFFPEGEKSYETRFLFAECLYETGRFEQAARQYERVSKTEPFHQYREKAASKRIQCLETLRRDKRIEVDTLLAAYQDYLELHPETEKATMIQFKQGEILFNAERYDQAAHVFRNIIQAHPRHPNVLRAWTLEMEALFEAGNYVALEETALAFAQKPFNLTQNQKDRTEHLLRFSQFQRAHADQETNNFIEAAQRYERLVEEAPLIEIAPDALYNAAICYQKADDPAKAAGCYEKIVLHYPNSKNYADALLAPLPYYEKTEQWDRLLLHLEKLYRKDPRSSLAKETLYKLAKRVYKNKDYVKSREVFGLYKSYYPEDISRKLEIAYLEAQMSEEQGHAEGALQGYRSFLGAYEKAKAGDPSLDVDPLYLITARFRTLDPLYQEYTSIELREPLKRNLARKQSLLDRVVSGYMETAKSGVGEYALASAFRVGDAYENFWKSLLTSAIPKGLSEEETRVYKELLKEQGIPYLDKALASYRVTLEKARERKMFNEWVLITYGRLAFLDPDQYPPMLQDSLVWKETWKAKQSLIKTIDLSKARAFSDQKAASLQSALDTILNDLRQGMKTDKRGPAPILDAIRRLDELLKKEPTLYEVQFNRGILYQMIGESAKARVDYQRSLQQHPDNPVAHLNLGLIELADGNLKEAEYHFAELCRISPRYAGAYYLLGVCHGKLGDYAKAVDPLKRAISLLPQFLDPYVELGKVQRELGQESEARNSWLEVLNHPKASPRVLRKLGYRLLEAGRTEESIKAYTRILRGQEAKYEDWNNRGVAHLRNGNLKLARKDIDQALEIEPNRPEALNNWGRILVEGRSYQRAASSFSRVLQVEPSFHAALLNAAVVHGQYLNDMETAKVYLQEYLDRGGTLQREMIRGWLAGSGKGKEGPAS